MDLKPEGIAGEPRIERALRWRPSGEVIAIAAALAFLVKLQLALGTYGTNDVYRWELYGNLSHYLGAPALYRRRTGLQPSPPP